MQFESSRVREFREFLMLDRACDSRNAFSIFRAHYRRELSQCFPPGSFPAGKTTRERRTERENFFGGSKHSDGNICRRLPRIYWTLVEFRADGKTGVAAVFRGAII